MRDVWFEGCHVRFCVLVYLRSGAGEGIAVDLSLCWFCFRGVVHFRGVDGMVWDGVELKRKLNDAAEKKFGSDKLVGMRLSWP